MVDELSYTIPKATSIVLWSCTTYKPIRSTTTSEGSIGNPFAFGSAQLPFVLTHAPKSYISGASMWADWCDAIWDNSILIVCCNSCCILSKLRMCSSSTALCQASCSCLFSSSTSFCISSFRSPMILANYCWLIDGEEVLEARDTRPKYWLIDTPAPLTWTRPGCSGRHIAVFSMSCRPCGTNFPCVAYSSKESWNIDNF